MTISAPARTNDVKSSSTARASSSHPCRRRCFEHRIFTAYVEDRERNVESLARGAQHVEVWKPRLDHDDIGAFGNVERDLAQRLARVGRIHLIAVPVAELRRRSRRFAERAVECRGVLCAVRHDRDVLRAVAVQCAANRRDASVHHIGGRDDVGPCRRVGAGDPAEELDGRIVFDRAVSVQDAAVTVIGVLAAAEIGDDDHLRHRLLDRANRALNDSFGIVAARCRSVLGGGNAEEQHALDAERKELACRGDGAVELEACDAGHRLDRSRIRGAFGDEERLDELLDVDAVLANERAHDLGAAQTPRTYYDQFPTPELTVADCKRSAISAPSSRACASVAIARSSFVRTSAPRSGA